MNALLCGVVAWPQFKVPVSAGSRLGMLGPEDCRTLPPTADEVAVLACEEAFWLVPGVVPELVTDALLGPAVTVVDTPRANPPACACSHRGIGDLRAVALDRDIQVVLERQRDGVLQARGTGCRRAAAIRAGWNWPCSAARRRAPRMARQTCRVCHAERQPPGLCSAAGGWVSRRAYRRPSRRLAQPPEARTIVRDTVLHGT